MIQIISTYIFIFHNLFSLFSLTKWFFQLLEISIFSIFLYGISKYFMIQMRDKFTLIFFFTLRIFSISWMHLFYYLLSNPRYEVTNQVNLRPISSEVFYNLKCMLFDSMKHRDTGLDFAYALESGSGERREQKRSSRKREIVHQHRLSILAVHHAAFTS